MKISHEMKHTHRVRGNLYRDILTDELSEHNYKRDQVMLGNIRRRDWTFHPFNEYFIQLLTKRIKQYEDFERTS